MYHAPRELSVFQTPSDVGAVWGAALPEPSTPTLCVRPRSSDYAHITQGCWAGAAPDVLGEVLAATAASAASSRIFAAERVPSAACCSAAAARHRDGCPLRDGSAAHGHGRGANETGGGERDVDGRCEQRVGAVKDTGTVWLSRRSKRTCFCACCSSLVPFALVAHWRADCRGTATPRCGSQHTLGTARR